MERERHVASCNSRTCRGGMQGAQVLVTRQRAPTELLSDGDFSHSLMCRYARSQTYRSYSERHQSRRRRITGCNAQRPPHRTATKDSHIPPKIRPILFAQGVGRRLGHAR